METPFNRGIEHITAVIRHGVFRRTNPGWYISSRTIEDHEFVLIEKGKGIVCIEGINYEAYPGMLFYFYPGLVHSLKTDDTDPFSFLAVHFSYGFLKKEDALEFVPGTSKLPFATVRKLAFSHSFSEALRKTVEHVTGKFPGWELAARFNLESFIHQLLREYSRKHINYGALMKVEATARFINDHIDMKPDLPLLARQACVTPDYLSRIFKSYTGHSLISYIHQCKVQQARLLLMESNLKIKDIAAALGFSDEFHFSRIFKKVEGVSPKVFMEAKQRDIPWSH